jgi:hypothetical protein
MKTTIMQRSHQAIHDAKERGLCVLLCCVNCGSDEYVEGHHPDYTKKLEVIWLCRSCHHKLHPGREYSADQLSSIVSILKERQKRIIERKEKYPNPRFMRERIFNKGEIKIRGLLRIELELGTIK